MNIINKVLKFFGFKKEEPVKQEIVTPKEVVKEVDIDNITPITHLEKEVKEVTKPKVKRAPKPKKENTSESKPEAPKKKRQPRKKVENK